jgi:DNA-binding beta-propeller fold protein YncE
MKFPCAKLVLLAITVAPLTGVAEGPPLKLIEKFQLSGIKGRFDHFGVDLKTHRLFATPEDDQTLLVIDLNTGRVMHKIAGIARTHAVLYREDPNRIYVTDGVAGVLKIYDGKTYELFRSVSLLKDADSIGYDDSAKQLYIVNGGEDEGLEYSMISVVDTTEDKKIADIRVEGKTLEAMALDEARPRMYVNNTAKNRVEVVDRWKRAVVASWPITLAKTNVSMAVDERHQRLFVGCRNGQLVVFDTNTGKELQALPIPQRTDDLIYDAGGKRLYITGIGSVTVFEQEDADHYKALGTVATLAGARTARLVPEIGRYFVAAPAVGSENAAVLVYETAGVPRTKAVSSATPRPVHAPAAERMVLAALSAHPDLRRLGLHAVAPGETESVIIANGNAGRIGFKSSQGDLAAVKDGKDYCAKVEDGAHYNIKLPMFDAANRRIGILVMELPFTSAADEADALRTAKAIRRELAQHIPNLTSLFEEN